MSNSKMGVEIINISTPKKTESTLEIPPGFYQELDNELARWKRIAEESEKIHGLVGPSKPRF